MSIRLAGKGTVPEGHYKTIKSKGSVRLHGKVKCVSFSASGASKGDNIDCTKTFKALGRTTFSENIKAANINVCGKLSCYGALEADETISLHGNSTCKNQLSCYQLSSVGILKVGEDIKAKYIDVAGAVHCKGLMSARNIQIESDRVMNIGSIECNNITIKRKRISPRIKRRVIVDSVIEGDNITLSYVTCKKVIGKNVTIGKGCKIDVVQYEYGFKASKKSNIWKIEKTKFVK